MLYLLNMADQEEKKELWVAWTKAAVSNYEPPEFEDDDEDHSDELADDMVTVSVKYADAMLEEYEARFNDGKPRGRRKKKPDPDPDDDDD